MWRIFVFTELVSLSSIEESARTLVVLDVDAKEKRVNNTHTQPETQGLKAGGGS